MSLAGVKNVQFVSKPIEAPFRDGSKCLVRDLCLHLPEVRCHVLTAGGPLEELEQRVVPHRIYARAGSYRPGLGSNLRAAGWLALSPRADVWHFLFAPNPRSSQVGRLLRALRGVPTVQTIASPPRSFVQPRRLLFGDRIVAQSHWTRAQFQQAFRDEGRPVPEIEVIFPPTPRVQRRDSEHVQGELARLGLTSRGPLFVYPGDLEVGGGAETTLEIARSLADALPKAQVVLAYRKKTRRADEIASDLQRRADPERVKIVPDVPDILALLQGAAAVLFPVDDLYGKVDLPIVLLEALALGTPVLCLDQGPLRDLEGALRLPSAVSAWVSPLVELAGQGDLEGRLRAAGPRATSAHFSAERAAARYDALYRSLW